jgi:hypothetical protein
VLLGIERVAPLERLSMRGRNRRAGRTNERAVALMECIH